MKRLSVDAKMNAYHEAIDHLRNADSDGCDTVAERDMELKAYLWLADKLEHELQKWYSRQKAR